MNNNNVSIYNRNAKVEAVTQQVLEKFASERFDRSNARAKEPELPHP
jgi:hypothetical protein